MIYFPSEMNFQYFFFSTYPGYFLQALPIALLVGGVYGVVRYRGERATPRREKLLSCVFVCYMTGLICLVVGLDMMGIAWYQLLYRMDPGRRVGWFSGEFDVIPDFFRRINGEVVGNVLMFLPFGVLHPLSNAEPTWRHTVSRGLLWVLVIELFQPVVGRAFDMNDIILNMAGIVVSASVFFAARCLMGKNLDPR